jgi:acetolactate synthase-1/3 small subunit
VEDVSAHDHVERDLMLIKVKASEGQRSNIRELCEIFRGKIVDVAPEQVMVEIAGQEKKIEAFIDLMRPFGIIELVRTGRIAMVRGIDRSNHNGAAGLRKTAEAVAK